MLSQGYSQEDYIHGLRNVISSFSFRLLKLFSTVSLEINKKMFNFFPLTASFLTLHVAGFR